MKTNLVKKEVAIKLRKKGQSIRDIENALGIRRSTLSGWLRSIKLTKEQKEKLHQKWLAALVKARLKAAEINRNERLERIERIKQGTEEFMLRVKIDKTLGELMLAIFYLAEGTKRENAIVIANSDPETLKSFLNLFRYVYQTNESKFRCCLHLRKDQTEKRLKKYWSGILDIPETQFIKTQFDKRTNKPTFEIYKGVCVVIYYDMDLQRRIIYIGENLLQRISKI